MLLHGLWAYVFRPEPDPVCRTSRHVEPTLPVPQRRRKDTPSTFCGSQIQLRPPIEGMSNEFPVDQVPTVIDGHTGEELEGRSRDEVVVSGSADGGIGVESGQDGVTVGSHDAL
jgi:hypothetical protein